MNGYGIFTDVNGDTYKGGFKDGMFDGKGTYQWMDGRKCIGNWYKNKVHGDGYCVNPEG